MQLVLDEDQRLLAETAREFVRHQSPLGRMRALRDSRGELGYDPQVYRRMAELGWTAIPFGEADGGLGMGLAEVVIVTEALGRALAPEPYLSSVMLAGQALSLAGDTPSRANWLPRLIAGDAVLGLALYEAHSRFDALDVRTTASPVADGFRLSGEKHQVMDGFGADALIVTARTEAEGLGLFVVPKDAAGLEVQRQWRVDARNAALVRLDGVHVGHDQVLAGAASGGALLEQVISRATVALCGEMLGGMSEALDRTLAYLKERKQFGVPIGSFQALQHRAARLFIEVELTRSLVMAAARALDEGHERAPALVSAAKARASDAYVQIASEAIQLHGGIGMTDEHDIGFFLKRAKVAEMTFGDAGYHRDRFAALHDF